MTAVAGLRVHGRLDGEVAGTSLRVVGTGREVEVTTSDPRTLAAEIRRVASSVPRTGAASTSLDALEEAGLVVRVVGPRGHLASVGDVGRGGIRPGRAALRPALLAGTLLAALVAAVRLLQRRPRGV